LVLGSNDKKVVGVFVRFSCAASSVHHISVSIKFIWSSDDKIIKY
jgi:hypothetical protein